MRIDKMPTEIMTNTTINCDYYDCSWLFLNILLDWSLFKIIKKKTEPIIKATYTSFY